MAKTIFEEMGGKYERQGDYLIPVSYTHLERYVRTNTDAGRKGIRK